MEAHDKLAIQELLARSAYALDHKDLDALEACFAEHADFKLTVAGSDPQVFSTRAGIMDLMKGALEAQTDERRHVVSNVFFSAESADEATVVSYLSLFATEDGETRLITTGVYTDTVTRVDGAWRILVRDLLLDRPY